MTKCGRKKSVTCIWRLIILQNKQEFLWFTYGPLQACHETVWKWPCIRQSNNFPTIYIQLQVVSNYTHSCPLYYTFYKVRWLCLDEWRRYSTWLHSQPQIAEGAISTEIPVRVMHFLFLPQIAMFGSSFLVKSYQLPEFFRYLITWNFRDTLISRISQLKKKSQNLSDAKI